MGYTIYSFIIIVAWVANICSVLINLVELFQLLTHINSVFLGLTILAWANCIAGKNSKYLDYISCMILAKKGYA
jgi:Ca2+/Na+ antiporter